MCEAMCESYQLSNDEALPVAVYTLLLAHVYATNARRRRRPQNWDMTKTKQKMLSHSYLSCAGSFEERKFQLWSFRFRLDGTAASAVSLTAETYHNHVFKKTKKNRAVLQKPGKHVGITEQCR